MAQYIIINAYKGGVLKTTITSNLGSILALNSKKILLVGLDAQDDLRISFNIPENILEKNLYDLLVDDVDISECIYKYNENIHLILSDERMENYEFDVLTNIYKKEDYMTALDSKLSKVVDDYDYIIVDTAPSFSILSLQAYYLNSRNGKTTDIIIPFQPEVYALKNLVRQITKINRFKAEFNTDLHIKSVIATKTMKNNTHRMILNSAKQALDKQVDFSNIEIRNTIKFTEYLLTNTKPLALEKDEDLNKEYKQFKQLYFDFAEELGY